MMNYEIFKEVLKKKIKEYMPSEFKNYKVVERKVHKVNCDRDAINVVSAEKNKGISGSPTIYIDSLYEMYKQGESMGEIIRDAADMITEGYNKMPEIMKDEKLDMDKLKERLIVTLVNTAQNENYLKGVPHREFLDLSVVYRCLINTDKNGTSSIVVTNDLAETMGMNEAQLYEQAMANTPKLLPVSIRPMDEIICEIILKEMGEAQDIVSREETMSVIDEVKGSSKGMDLYVMTNSEKFNGASELLFPENLDELSKKFDSDIYIIPSSTHEIIAISSIGKDVNELQEMVNEVNMNEVLIEDRLSNEVYHYDKNKKELTVASDAPNKSLDDNIVAEPLSYDRSEKTL